MPFRAEIICFLNFKTAAGLSKDLWILTNESWNNGLPIWEKNKSLTDCEIIASLLPGVRRWAVHRCPAVAARLALLACLQVGVIRFYDRRLSR